MSGYLAGTNTTFLHELACLRCSGEGLTQSHGIYYLLSNGGHIGSVFHYNLKALKNLAEHLKLSAL
jgi:hypothetical protein